jgi:hypothetical protein
MKVVIPGLTRNPMFLGWIPALVPFRVFAGMTHYVVICDAVCHSPFLFLGPDNDLN